MSTIRNFTKLEKQLLNLKPTEAQAIINLFDKKTGVKSHPLYWTKNGRHQQLVGIRPLTTAFDLKKMGFIENDDYVIGNDAPKQGQEGNFIALTAKGKAKAKRIMA